MRILALAVTDRGLVDPEVPVVHADDEALLRGRAAFETMRVYGGRPFRLDEHLERLAGSASRIGLPPVDVRRVESLSSEAITAGGEPEAVLRLFWTPGREGTGNPVGIAIVSGLPDDLDARRAAGVRLVTLSLGFDADLRAASPWLLAGVKSTSYAVNMAAETEAHRRGADDAVLLTSDGTVLECPVSNVWWSYGDVLETPTLDLGILAGVTRAEVIRAATELGLHVQEGRFQTSRLAGAAEVFTSSSVREIMPAIAVDDATVGDGSPGPTAHRIQSALRAAATNA